MHPVGGRTVQTQAAVGAVRLAAAGLAVIAVCYGLARFAYGLFVPAFTVEFGLGAAAAGAIASSSYAGYCVAVVAATLATVRWGPRAVATAAGLAAVLGTGLIALAPGVPVLAVGVVIAGSSTGLASPPLADAVARWVRADRADRVQTVVNAGTGVGVAVSGPIALLLFGSWRLAWATYCGIAVLVTAWTVATIPGGRTRRQSEDAARGPWWRPGTGRLLLAAAALGAGSAAVWVFGRDLVVTAGVSAAASTLMWIALGVAGVAGAFTGDLVARTGLGRAWVAGMLLLAAATAAFALAPGVLPVVFVAAALFGAVYIGLTAVLLVWGTRTYPDAPALGVGAAFLLIAVGQTLAAPALGLLSDLTTAPVAFGAAAIAAAGGALALPRA
ncbi:YbfB/YjiJ family MFS transporter [Pseudonocardia sp. DSM 110487]|nr:YbfB/YjiJ family MFS transporter [Pseudonocardia sp. DSM 110487]